MGGWLCFGSDKQLRRLDEDASETAITRAVFILS